ncbi:hypothetical protein AAHH88_00185 [Candidatus Hodgkinia cicadicola]
MVVLIGQTGESLGCMSFSEAQRIALVNRLRLVRENDVATFKLVDLGKQKCLKKKAYLKARLANRVIKKHIEIKSNIDKRDLEIKLRAISRFLDSDYKASVIANRLRPVTARSAYDEFLFSLIERLSQVARTSVRPVSTEGGDNMFCLGGSGV